MAAWDQSAAIATLRSLLGDNVSDKFEFKADVFPSVDGVTKKFFVGQTRVVPNSLSVYVDGNPAVSGAPSGVVAIDHETGTFDLGVAPSGSVEVQASFRYQWFTDAELTDFLTAAGNLLNFETIDDPALPLGVRGAMLDFAAYYAYMKKAAEFADSLVATAAGYEADQSKSGPNWRDLAKLAYEKARDKLKLYVENPLGAATPEVRFIAFRLANWQGL